ncbi:2268_t:CDS:1, partial [Funneliformis geosporum]
SLAINANYTMNAQHQNDQNVISNPNISKMLTIKEIKDKIQDD